MANLEEDMNVEAQLQVAFSTIAELRDQNAVLNKTVWSLEERLRISDESREDLKRFYENQMDALRSDQQRLIDAAVAQITRSFEEQMAKLIAERNAALLSAKRWRGKKYGRGSERNAGHDDDPDGSGENRESEKADFVSPEDQAGKDAGKTSAATSDRETVDVAKDVARLKRRHPGAEVRAERIDYSKSSAGKGKKDRRSACLVHIRRGFVDAMPENRAEAMWFIDEFGKMFAVEHYCMTHGLKGAARLVERLKKGSTADIMARIEERLEVFRRSGYAGCGELLAKALKYAASEWPAMRRVLEDGDVELSNNLSEQMMRSIKMNLKNAGNIGSEESAAHNVFMFSVIESCRMCGRSVERYLTGLLERLKTAKDGDDMTGCLPCFMPV